MQTFLPYESFAQSAKCLDRQRLGKQRVEVMQLLKALAGETIGWVNHPACKMWRGYERWLVAYGGTICGEWVGRGYRDTCLTKIIELGSKFPTYSEQPPWLGDEAFHRSHQSNLIRKDPAHYGPLFPGVPNDLPYIWPESEVTCG